MASTTPCVVHFPLSTFLQKPVSGKTLKGKSGSVFGLFRVNPDCTSATKPPQCGQVRKSLRVVADGGGDYRVQSYARDGSQTRAILRAFVMSEGYKQRGERASV
jgi:hypothetical protein